MSVSAQIHRLLDGRDVVVGELKLAADGTMDFGGLRPEEEWLRDYLCVDIDRGGKRVSAAAGERWLTLLPENLHGSFCWASAHNDRPVTGRKGVPA